MSQSAKDGSLSQAYPKGSLYEDVITKRIWSLSESPNNLRGKVFLTPYAVTQTGEVLEVETATFIASKRFQPVPENALVVTPEGVFIHMDEELQQTTFGSLEDYMESKEAKSLGNVINFTRRVPSENTLEAVPPLSMDYNPLTRVAEMRDRLTELASCHRKILVETESLLSTLTAFERDFKVQLGLPVSDI